MPELLISADSHVMEPLDLWTRHLPPRLRDRGPRVEARDGRACLLVEERVVRKFGAVDSGEESALHSAQDEVASGLASFGAREPDARLRDLDRDGVWGEVMYPNLAFFCAHRIEDAEVEQATCRVYNDWVAEHFLQSSPRFCPVAILEHHAWVTPKLDLLPSEYFRRQGAVTFQNDPVGFHNLRFTGERSLMWGSDYPHPEGTWPESQKALAEQLADVPAHVAERITCRNAAELYAFDLAAAPSNA